MMDKYTSRDFPAILQVDAIVNQDTEAKKTIGKNPTTTEKRCV
jgi:hypothetical protein